MTYTLRSCTGTYVMLLELHATSPSGDIQLTGVLAGIRIIFGPATLVCVATNVKGIWSYPISGGRNTIYSLQT